jgi:hypothetical protein
MTAPQPPAVLEMLRQQEAGSSAPQLTALPKGVALTWAITEKPSAGQ